METKNKKIIAIVLLVVVILIVAIVIINQNKKESIKNELNIESNKVIINSEEQDGNEIQYINVEGNRIELPKDAVDDNPSTTLTTPIDEQDKVESSMPTM